MTEEQVLGLLASSRRAWTAYEIADRLTERQFRVAPPQVYRALTRLCILGKVRRIESLNAYAYGSAAGLLSLLCRQCRGYDAIEGEELGAQMEAVARQAGFQVERLVFEIQGLCRRCSKLAIAAALLILGALPPVSGEALACPYHMPGASARFGPFDAAGGWRDDLTGDQTQPFDTGPTATQPLEPQETVETRQTEEDGTSRNPTERGPIE
jgi:Fur family zinc uptake transcriptional regulator